MNANITRLLEDFLETDITTLFHGSAFQAPSLTPESRPDTPATPQPPASGRPLVNYIWINKSKAVANPANRACSINLANVMKATTNANLYPDADFRIWVDKNLLDEYSLFCLESFIADHARAGNIRIHNLQDIPDYANDLYFVPLDSGKQGGLSYMFNSRSSPRNVYSRADYARILVLDHCMKTAPEQNRLIYSDIDCPDIRLPEALATLDKYGVVIHDLGEGCVSHGYIGLVTDNEAVKTHFEPLKWETRRAAHDDELGFKAFDAFLTKLGMPNSTWHNVIGLTDLLPPIGALPGSISYTPKGKFEFPHQPPAPENTGLSYSFPFDDSGVDLGLSPALADYVAALTELMTLQEMPRQRLFDREMKEDFFNYDLMPTTINPSSSMREKSFQPS